MKTIEVVAGIIFDKDKVFATQRGYGNYKGWWEFPGGKLEVGETPQDALKRELREELQIEVSVKDFIKIVECVYPEYKVILHCYEAEIVSGEPVLLEHMSSRWLNAEELHNLMWLKSDLEVLDDIQKIMLDRR